MKEQGIGYGFYALTLLGAVLASGWVWKLRGWQEIKQLRWISIGLIIAAFIYVIFSLFSLNIIWIAVEVLGLILFSMFVWMGFHYSPWFVAMGWLLHVIWDYGLHPNQSLPYVPGWYPALCIGFDTVIALYLAYWLIAHGKAMEHEDQFDKSQ